MERGDEMSLNDMMTNLMDKARPNYHVTDKLSIPDLTKLMDKPGINSPLSISQPEWLHVTGWGATLKVIVPVYLDIPIYATVELKGITSTVANQGASLLTNYMDKNGNFISYWDVDNQGNYKQSGDPVQMQGNSFSNKNGTRIGTRTFDKSNIRNVAYLVICAANNCVTEYDLRNLIVSYYKAYTYADIMGEGSATQPAFNAIQPTQPAGSSGSSAIGGSLIE